MIPVNGDIARGDQWQDDLFSTSIIVQNVHFSLEILLLAFFVSFHMGFTLGQTVPAVKSILYYPKTFEQI